MDQRIPPPGPERDRRLAAQPRRGPRQALPVEDLVASFMGSEEVKRMRRFQQVAGALRAVLDARALARVRPVQLRSGVLTLEVSDGLLLAELRQHRAHELLAKLAESGTGVSRLQWRLARS